jgi:hypothetical protein
MALAADERCMNGWLKAATLVPAMGLIPLGFAAVAPFIRLAPVAVRNLGEGAGRAIGASR